MALGRGSAKADPARQARHIRAAREPRRDGEEPSAPSRMCSSRPTRNRTSG